MRAENRKNQAHLCCSELCSISLQRAQTEALLLYRYIRGLIINARCKERHAHGRLYESCYRAYLQAPLLMAALYSVRCHSRKDSGRPKPEMSAQKSQSPRLLCPTANLYAARTNRFEARTCPLRFHHHTAKPYLWLPMLSCWALRGSMGVPKIGYVQRNQAPFYPTCNANRWPIRVLGPGPSSELNTTAHT